jgi:sn-glycerol 3-phosphate transport system ATP-binding protein
VRSPKVFLFDEPLSNLDAKLRGQMRVEIKKLQRALGVTAVYVTHDQLEAMTLADILVVMNGGLVEQAGAPLDIYEKPASTFVASFIGAPPMNMLPVATAGSPQAPAGAATVGFRPEDAVVGAAAGSGGLQLDVVVDGVEPVGAESYVYCSSGDQRLVVRVSGRSASEIGERLTINAPAQKLHWFGADEKRVS